MVPQWSSTVDSSKGLGYQEFKLSRAGSKQPKIREKHFDCAVNIKTTLNIIVQMSSENGTIVPDY